MKPQRIYIFGTSGAGKTTVARLLSRKLDIPSYDLDDLFWKQKYDVKRSERERNSLLKRISNRPRWIIEGVYDSWVDDAVKKSDLALVLDFHPLFITYRILRRFFQRRRDGSNESIKDTWILIKYIWRYHDNSQAAGYLSHLRLIQKNKIRFLRIRTSKELKRFLKEFAIWRKHRGKKKYNKGKNEKR